MMLRECLLESGRYAGQPATHHSYWVNLTHASLGSLMSFPTHRNGFLAVSFWCTPSQLKRHSQHSSGIKSFPPGSLKGLAWLEAAGCCKPPKLEHLEQKLLILHPSSDVLAAGLVDLVCLLVWLWLETPWWSRGLNGESTHVRLCLVAGDGDFSTAVLLLEGLQDSVGRSFPWICLRHMESIESLLNRIWKVYSIKTQNHGIYPIGQNTT